MAKPCRFCGSLQHTGFRCFKRPRKEKAYKKPKPIRAVSKKTAQKRRDVSKEWYDLNPPDENGLWPCYLRIAPNCERFVNRQTINLEHKKSKVRHPELRYVVSNIGAACQPCNKLKGSEDDTDFDVQSE